MHRSWLGAARWSWRGLPLNCFNLGLVGKPRTLIWVVTQADSRVDVASVD